MCPSKCPKKYPSKGKHTFLSSCCLVAKSCPTVYNSMDCSTPGFLVLHCLPVFAQTHVHRVGDAIQPSHPLSLSSPSAFNLSQHQAKSFPVSQLIASGGQRIGASASVLPMNIQGWFPLGLTGLTSLLSKGLSRVFSSTTVQRHQFFGTQPFFIVLLSYLCMTTGKTIALTRWTFVSNRAMSKYHLPKVSVTRV